MTPDQNDPFADAKQTQRCPACGRETLQYFTKRASYLCVSPDCGEELSPTISAGNSGHLQDLSHLPFPVAFPLHHAAHPDLGATDRINNLIFASYQAMRTTGLLLLADYLHCDKIDSGLASAIRGLRMPHWQEWSVLCSKLSQFWSQESNKEGSHFPSLVARWRLAIDARTASGNEPWAVHLEDFAGLSGAARNPLDALQKLRNDRAHRTATVTAGASADEALFPKLNGLVRSFIHGLFEDADLDIYCRTEANPGVAFHLRGPHPDLQFHPEPIDPNGVAAFAVSAVVAKSNGAFIPVYPLFVAPGQLEESSSVLNGLPDDPIAMLDGADERKVVLLGVNRWVESCSIAPEIQSILAAKNADTALTKRESKWDVIAEASNENARATLRRLTGRKYFPASYMERDGVDDAVSQYTEINGYALLVCGEPGAGKSSLLARLVDRLLPQEIDARMGRTPPALPLAAARHDPPSAAHPKNVVLFLSGRQDLGGSAVLSDDQLLCAALLRAASVKSDAFPDLASFIRHLATTRPGSSSSAPDIWIVLDGLNEADRFIDLVHALDRFLPLLTEFPGIRLIASMRIGAYESLQHRHVSSFLHGEVFENAVRLLNFSGSSHASSVPYLSVRSFRSEDEVRAAYEVRQRSLPDLSCSAAFESLPATTRELLRTPLFLDLFHRALAGSDSAVEPLDAGQLFATYLTHLESQLPGLQPSLRMIADRMIELRRPEVPADELELWVAAQRAGRAAAEWMGKLDPIEELVSASLLLRPTRQGRSTQHEAPAYQFTHQLVCESVLRRKLESELDDTNAISAKWLKRWAKSAFGSDQDDSGFSELVNAIQDIAVKAHAEHGRRVTKAVDGLPDTRIRLRLLAAITRWALRSPHSWKRFKEDIRDSRRISVWLESFRTIEEDLERKGLRPELKRLARFHLRILTLLEIKGANASQFAEVFRLRVLLADIDWDRHLLRRARRQYRRAKRVLNRLTWQASSEPAWLAHQIEWAARVPRITGNTLTRENAGSNLWGQRSPDDEELVTASPQLQVQIAESVCRTLRLIANDQNPNGARNYFDVLDLCSEMAQDLYKVEPESPSIREALAISRICCAERVIQRDGITGWSDTEAKRDLDVEIRNIGEGLSVLESLIEDQPFWQRPVVFKARALRAEGGLRILVGSIDLAQSSFDQAIVLLDRLKSVREIRRDVIRELSCTHASRAALWIRAGNVESALSDSRRALSLHRKLFRFSAQTDDEMFFEHLYTDVRLAALVANADCLSGEWSHAAHVLASSAELSGAPVDSSSAPRSSRAIVGELYLALAAVHLVLQQLDEMADSLRHWLEVTENLGVPKRNQATIALFNITASASGQSGISFETIQDTAALLYGTTGSSPEDRHSTWARINDHHPALGEIMKPYSIRVSDELGADRNLPLLLREAINCGSTDPTRSERLAAVVCIGLVLAGLSLPTLNLRYSKSASMRFPRRQA